MTRLTKEEKAANKVARQLAKQEAAAALAAAEVAETETDEEETDEEETPKLTMAQQLRKHKAKYEATVSYTNRPSLHNGDAVATVLAGLSPDQTCHLAETLKEMASGELVARYSHLNPGQRRMNAGNLIRGAIKRGDNTIAELAAIPLA